MSHRQSQRIRGFTLIEVLVALVIVAVGMSALMSALSSSARTVTYMQDKTFAEWVALNQIALVRLQLTQGQLPPTEKTNGEIELASRTWVWRQEVVRVQVPGLVRIDVKVRPKDLKAGDDEGWYVTMSGIVGNALAAPGSATIQWDPTLGISGLPGGGLNQGTTLGNGENNGSNNGTTTTPKPANPSVPTNPNKTP